jgi:hypothetical protein
MEGSVETPVTNSDKGPFCLITAHGKDIDVKGFEHISYQ